MAERLPISTAHCTVERDGHVVIVTMNRPEARNALSSAMLVGMADAFAYITQTPDVRVGILTGAEGHFCAGADLKAMGAPPDDEHLKRRMAEIPNFHWRGLLRENVPTKPLICAVEGYAVAGGTELLLGTDLRVVAESATLGLYEAKRGLFPMGGSAIRLPRQIGHAAAMEILLTARPVSAQEALAMGLVNKVVPDGQALAAARELADRIAANAPLSVQAILRAHRQSWHLPEEEALQVADEIGWPIFETKDAAEGTRAFREKRDPIFIGE